MPQKIIQLNRGINTSTKMFFNDCQIEGKMYAGRGECIDGQLYPVDGEAFIDVPSESVKDIKALPPA